MVVPKRKIAFTFFEGLSELEGESLSYSEVNTL